MSGQFFNTMHLTGNQLRNAITAAEDQNAAILAIYSSANRPLSPSDVWRVCESHGKRWPLTSVRRAITTLTHAGALTQTGSVKRGIYGRAEHSWELMGRAA